MMAEDKVIFRMQQIDSMVNILSIELARGLYQPERETSSEKVLCNSYIMSKNAHGVSHLKSRGGTFIHLRLINLHVIKDSPKL